MTVNMSETSQKFYNTLPMGPSGPTHPETIDSQTNERQDNPLEDPTEYRPKEELEFSLVGQTSRVAYSATKKMIFIGDYDGYITCFKFYPMKKRIYPIKTKKVSNSMINDLYCIDEKGYPSFLILRSDRSVLISSVDFERVESYDFSQELSTCNGLYLNSYST